MKMSGIRRSIASHAIYIEPKLCPSSVTRFHVPPSTRYLDGRKTNAIEDGLSRMPNRDLQTRANVLVS